MFSKDKIIFNLVQNIFVGLAITFTVTLCTTGLISFGVFISSFIKAYLINFIACLVIPTDMLARLTCKKLNCSSNMLMTKIINVLYCDIGYVTVISVVMFIWELGINSMTFRAWRSVYGYLLLVGFIIGFLMSPISLKIASKLNKEK